MNYWWINAKERWNWTDDSNVEEMVEWCAVKKDGTTKSYCNKVRKGDLIFGYNAGEQKEIVALARITKEKYINDNGETVIGITKIKDLKNPISIDQIRKNKFLKDKFSDGIKLRGTIHKLEIYEFDELLRMI
ncbi:EVE domain-containing protein [Clostridium sp. ZS2-4]|uniref:EVE domain-containing protein n=1 Tax=Clostridium sp. ZS2-4 TaxID=2987703 RepID=UPI00227A4CC7|nr:EVE domain-containing protein [Clostridium sp. ZS2-4]MCY6355364.1 EVE domain-containing protein [Clostridium sp. ZS2-4]